MEDLEIIMPKLKKILLTGATGFIGSHLTELLINKNYHLTIIKRKNSSNWRIAHLNSKIKNYNITGSNLETLFRKNRFDCIIHLATHYKKYHQGLKDLESMIESNILFPSQLAELAVKYKVKYFINTGTFFEYQLKGKNIITELTPIKPYNLYAATKISFEQHLKYYSDKYNIKVISLKLFAPYGEKDNDKLIVILIKNLLTNKKFQMTTGQPQWNFTYVIDITRAYLNALNYISKMKTNFEVFNIGQNQVVSIRKIAKTLEVISQKKFKIDWGAKKYLVDEIFYVNCYNNKARKLLKWKPQYSIKEGLKKTYNYYLRLYEKGNL